MASSPGNVEMKDIPPRPNQPTPRNPLPVMLAAVCSLASGALPWLAAFIAFSGEAEPDPGTADSVYTVFLFGSIVAIFSGVMALTHSKSAFDQTAHRLRRSITLATAWIGTLLGGAAFFSLAAGSQYM